MRLATEIVLLFLTFVSTLVLFNGRMPSSPYTNVEHIRAVAAAIRRQQWSVFVLALACLAALVGLEVGCG